MPIENRETVEDAYAEKIIGDMDIKTMNQFCYDMIMDNLSKMTDVEFIENIENSSYPEIAKNLIIAE